MQRSSQYVQLDVFTRRRFGGNQLAVFVDTDDWADSEMQEVAREMNFSECTFVQTPDLNSADYRVRIFTPTRELPMAGHPVIGTIFALDHLGWLDLEENTTEMIFELGVGATSLTLTADEDGNLDKAFMEQALPAFHTVPVSERELAAALNILPGDIGSKDLPIEWGSSGVPFLYVPIKSLARIGQVQPDMGAVCRLLDRVKADGLYCFTTETTSSDAKAHSRMFAPNMGITEDAATGGASGPFGVYLWRYGLVEADEFNQAQLVLEQGYEMGRPSQIQVELDTRGTEARAVRVGGNAIVVAEGDFFFEI